MNTGAVLFANNATSRLFAAVDAVTTSIRVSAGDGGKFPQPLGDGSNWFIVTLEDRRNHTLEICKCTGRSGDILTVARAQEGTTAKAFDPGANVSNRMTAGMMATFFTFNGYSTTEADARFVNVTGDTMTAPLVLPGAPTLDNQAATKRYVDDVSIDEAPTDGRAYGRQSVGWVPISVGLAEPPVDGKVYARGNLAWQESILKTAFDAEVTATNNDFAAFDGRVTANEDKNVEQDTRLGAIEGLNTTQDSRLTSVESKNTTQDSRLTAVEGKNTSQDSDIALRAPIASPTFTGDPKAPTPLTADSDTSIATTAFVKAQAYLTDAPSDGTTYGRNNGAWLASAAANSIVSVPADMSVGFKTGPSRLVFNNNVSITGADIGVMDDFGRMALTYTGTAAPAIPANSRSSITSYGDFTLVGAFTLGWNTYFDTVSAGYKAVAAGWGMYINANSANGNIAITRSSASVAAGAALTMQNLLFFDQAAGLASFLDKLAVAGAVKPATSRSALTMNGELTLPSSYGVGFNTYFDNTSFRAAVTGWGGFININPATGALALSRSTASAAADAVQTLTSVLTFDPTTGAAMADRLATNGAANPANSRSGLITKEEISLYGVVATAANLCFNQFFDTVAGALKAVVTGFSALWQLNQSNGIISLYRAASVAGGALTTNSPLMQFDPTLGTSFNDLLITYKGSGNKQIQCESANISNFKLDATGNFAWYRSSNGLVGGTLTNLMALDNTGTLSIANLMISSAGYHIGSATVAVLGTQGAGTCYLRPNGYASATGQTTIDSAGNVAIAGSQATLGGALMLFDVSCTLVGAYALCMNSGSVAAIAPDAGIAGSSLSYSSAAGLVQGAPAGSWRCMGNAGGNAAGVVARTTLFKRYV